MSQTNEMMGNDIDTRGDARSFLNLDSSQTLHARNSEAFSSRFDLMGRNGIGGIQSHSTLAIGRMSPMMRNAGGPFRKTKLFGQGTLNKDCVFFEWPNP